MKLEISADIETTSRHIACIGIGWSPVDAICIPIMDSASRGTNYWSAEEEFLIVEKLNELLSHPNVSIVWQNGSYDLQHIAKHWGIRAHMSDDTMLMQHVCFPGERKSLDYLASIYLPFYQYWKDELKDYRKLPDDTETFWTYNCKDCVITWELRHILKSMIESFKLEEQYEFLMRTNRNAIRAMLRGIGVDDKVRSEMALRLYDAIAVRQQDIIDWVGYDLNVNSPKQLADFFYGELEMKPVLQKGTYRPTCDSDALIKLAQREVLLRGLVQCINELRSLGVFLSTFINMPLDSDKRMRCSFNVGGTETFRLSSSENAFGNGGNLQNIPRNHED